MRIEIVRNSHGQYTYEVDGVRVHDSWDTLQKARKAALNHKESPKPVKPVKAKESDDAVPAV
jgi:hypothetical protein